MNTRTKGQVLLIGLMLIALVTTIIGTGVLRSTTSTKTTKQKEEANKASEAARGILEGGLNDEGNLSQNFTGVNKDATSLEVVNPQTTQEFLYNDIVGKDEQYLFYLTGYDPQNNSFTTDYFTQNLTVYFGSETGTCPLVELILIGANDNILARYYPSTPPACPTSSFNYPSSNPGHLLTGTTPKTITTGNGDSATFAFNTTISSLGSFASEKAKLLVVRPFFAGTKLGFGAGAGNLSPQGRVVSSTARTIDGAQKTETVYQAYPQIPLSLFATIF